MLILHSFIGPLTSKPFDLAFGNKCFVEIYSSLEDKNEKKTIHVQPQNYIVWNFYVINTSFIRPFFPNENLDWKFKVNYFQTGLSVHNYIVRTEWIYL